MLREMQVQIRKNYNTMCRAAMDMVTGMAAAIVEDRMVVPFDSSVHDEGALFLLERERLSNGIRTMRRDHSDYCEGFVRIREGDHVKLMAPEYGERYGTDQYKGEFSPGCSVIPQNGIWEQSDEPTRFVFAGFHEDVDRTLLVIEIQNGKSAVTDVRLSSVTLSGVEMNPPFNPNVYMYNCTSSTNPCSIDAVLMDTDNGSDVTVQHNGEAVTATEITWVTGINTLEIKVEHEETIKTYTFMVVYKHPDTYLSHMSFSNMELEPGFSFDNFEYNVNGDVTDRVCEFEIETRDQTEAKEVALTLNDDVVYTSTGTTLNGNIEFNEEGPFTLYIRSSLRAAFTNYKISGQYVEPPDARLKELIHASGTHKPFLKPSFDPDIYSYTIDMVESIWLMSVEKMDPDATIEYRVDGKTVSSFSLAGKAVGDTVVGEIIVRNGNEEKVYTITAAQIEDTGLYGMYFSCYPTGSATVEPSNHNPFIREYEVWSDKRILNVNASVKGDDNLYMTLDNGDAFEINRYSGQLVTLSKEVTKIELTVKKENGFEGYYTIIAHYTGDPDASLPNASLSSDSSFDNIVLTPSFDPDITEYTGDVNEATSDLGNVYLADSMMGDAKLYFYLNDVQIDRYDAINWVVGINKLIMIGDAALTKKKYTFDITYSPVS